MPSAREVVAAIKRAGALRDEAAAAQVALLKAARRDVLNVIGGAVQYKRFQLGEVLQGIDGAIAQYRSQAQSPSSRAIMQAAAAARQKLHASGVPLRSLYGVQTQLTQSIISVTNDQVRAVWSDLGTGLKVAVRRATLGIQDPFEAIQKLQRVFTRTDQWRSTEYHAERIIRTEVGRAYEMTGQEELEAAKEAGVDLAKWWLATDDGRTRETHLEAWRRYRPGGDVGPIPVDEAFEVGDVSLMYPGDPQGEGDEKELARETIQCFLPGTRIGGAVVAALESRYSGEARYIETRMGHSLSVTANHPILTARGWIPAKSIQEGDHVLVDRREIRDQQGASLPVGGVRNPHNQYVETPVQEIFQAFAAQGRRRLPVASALNLDSNARFLDDYVDVVAINGEVLNCIESATEQMAEHVGLIETSGIVRLSLSSLGALALPNRGMFSSPAGGMGGVNLGLAAILAHVRPLDPLLLGRAAQAHAAQSENASYRSARGAEASREAEKAFSTFVERDEVVLCEPFAYEGPVYDVQTIDGLVHSNGIVAHNCRCSSVPYVRGVSEAFRREACEMLREAA